MGKMKKAVVMAAGMGRRMQKSDDAVGLSEGQAAVAETGVKGLIPIDRPFLDYVLSALADAGYEQVCLVIGPRHDAVRHYYESLSCHRISIEFSVQEKPLGTANAVAAAEQFAGPDPFLVINSDNYYPACALSALREMDGSGLIAFERDGLVANSNIPPERVARFAILQVEEDGRLTRIVEKPSADFLAQQPEPICVSMNCWRFGPEIFRACRAICPSSRGEFEITDAVQYAIDHLGVRFQALQVDAGVLDMTSRSDVQAVAARLAGTVVEL